MAKTALAFIFVLSAFVGCKKEAGIESIEPNFGNVSGKDTVTIKGNGFKDGLTVQFGKLQAAMVVIDSSKQINVQTPPGPKGPVDVIITTADGNTYVLKDGFTYRSQM